MRDRWRSLRRRQREALAFAFGSGVFFSNALDPVEWWSLAGVVVAVLWLLLALVRLDEGEAATDE